MTDNKRQGPLIVQLDAPPDPPICADPIVSDTPFQSAVAVVGRRSNVLARWFWTLLLALIIFGVSTAIWNFIYDLMVRNKVVGYIGFGLLLLFLCVCLLVIITEFFALMRLSRVDRLQKDAKKAVVNADVGQAKKVLLQIKKLYRKRPDTYWAQARLDENSSDIFDADCLLGVVEKTLMTPLDQQATQYVESATRQVAMVTALSPVALVDVMTALAANLRMIRQVAEVYGGRSGVLGNLRLTRSVFGHLVATGALAVGDDVIGSIAGAGLLSKLSRRFGEGVVNGALTARVGIAAIEVCRPLPFVRCKIPKVTQVMARSIGGVFKADDPK